MHTGRLCSALVSLGAGLTLSSVQSLKRSFWGSLGYLWALFSVRGHLARGSSWAHSVDVAIRTSGEQWRSVVVLTGRAQTVVTFSECIGAALNRGGFTCSAQPVDRGPGLNGSDCIGAGCVGGRWFVCPWVCRASPVLAFRLSLRVCGGVFALLRLNRRYWLCVLWAVFVCLRSSAPRGVSGGRHKKTDHVAGSFVWWCPWVNRWARQVARGNSPESLRLAHPC